MTEPGDMVERVAELQLAAFLAGRGSVTSMKYGTRSAKPAPTMDEFRSMAKAALAASGADRMREALEEIKDLGSDGEHSGDRHARCRAIARRGLGEQP